MRFGTTQKAVHAAPLVMRRRLAGGGAHALRRFRCPMVEALSSARNDGSAGGACRCRAMQLQEMLVAMALGVALTGGALELWARTWQYCRQSAASAHSLQEVALVRQAWREFVHACPDEPTLGLAGTLTCGDWSAGADAAALVVTRGERTRRVGLPEGAVATITHEAGTVGAPCWVLTLAWRTAEFERRQPRHARLVACRATVVGQQVESAQ